MQYTCGQLGCRESISILGEAPRHHAHILRLHGWIAWEHQGRVISVRCYRHDPSPGEAVLLLRLAREIIAHRTHLTETALSLLDRALEALSQASEEAESS